MSISRKSLDFQLVQINKSKKTPATLQTVEYRCQIINNILKTQLVQTFRSLSSNEYSETLYYFPTESNVCLESFEAKYQDKMVKGIVKEKEQAQKEYQENKNQGNFVSYASVQKNPDQDYVHIKLGNLPPNEQVDIVLNFSQGLGSILNKYYIADIPLQYVQDEVSVKLGKNVLTLDLFCTGRISYAESKNPSTQKIQVDENTVRFSLSQEKLQQNQNLQIIYSFEGMFDPQVIFGSSKCYHEDKVKSAILPVSHSAMVTFIPNFNEEITKEIDDTIRAALVNGEDITSDSFQQRMNIELVDHLNSSRSEFLFLLDRSGSMSGRAIQRACEALSLFLKSLPNDSYFNVISFGSGMQKLFPQSLQYTTENLNRAVDIISKYQADLGGTEIYEPLADIFKTEKIKGYNKQIFLLTDGEVDRPQEVVGLVKKNNKFNRVHSIGFGSGADQYLIKQSAIAGNGISKIVDFSCDLSEVIIQMLQNCISPSFDDFTISYDKEIFDSTHPLTTNFPCVFKDEIINLHFFFKPLVDISTLTQEQKRIQIEYYDSHQKKIVIKEISLEMSDNFTCNSELQESVFKLGKQLYLNENITSQNAKSELIQQAVDFQLLTEKTALICVIETLNDVQKVMYENSSNDQVYGDLEGLPRQVHHHHISHSNVLQGSYSSDQSESDSGCDAWGDECEEEDEAMCAAEKSEDEIDDDEENEDDTPSYSNSPKINSCNKRENDSPCLSPRASTPKQNADTSNYRKCNILLPDVNGPCINDLSIQKECESPQKSSQQYPVSNESNVLKKKRKLQKKLKRKASSSSDKNSEEEQEEKDSMDVEENCMKENVMEEEDRKMEMCIKKQAKGEEEEEQGQLKQPSLPISIPQSKKRDESMPFENKQKQQKPKQINKVPQLKLEHLLKLVDSQGVWKFDENIIRELSNLDQTAISQFASSFSDKDAFMTLFILAILELFFNQEKTKWVLISKKSLNSIKKHINQGVDINDLKQNLLIQISQ